MQLELTKTVKWSNIKAQIVGLSFQVLISLVVNDLINYLILCYKCRECRFCSFERYRIIAKTHGAAGKGLFETLHKLNYELRKKNFRAWILGSSRFWKNTSTGQRKGFSFCAKKMKVGGSWLKKKAQQNRLKYNKNVLVLAFFAVWKT